MTLAFQMPFYCFNRVWEIAVLAFANTTKPLRRRYGLVVLANANKSAVPRVQGWPGEHLFGSIQFTLRTPPLAQIGYTC